MRADCWHAVAALLERIGRGGGGGDGLFSDRLSWARQRISTMERWRFVLWRSAESLSVQRALSNVVLWRHGLWMPSDFLSVISPNGGVFDEPLTVTLSCPTPGADYPWLKPNFVSRFFTSLNWKLREQSFPSSLGLSHEAECIQPRWADDPSPDRDLSRIG